MLLELSEEEYRQLEALSREQGQSVEALLRETLRPLLMPLRRRRARRKRRLFALSPGEYAHLRRESARALEELHRRIGEPIFSDSAPLIRELRERDA